MTAAIDALLREAVDTGAVPLAVFLAADDSGVVHESAAGPRAAGGSEPVTPEAVFRIASMTKPVVAAAALALVDDG